MHNENPRTFQQKTFLGKPGVLYRVVINSEPEIDRLFPHGCRESYFITNFTGATVERGGHVHHEPQDATLAKSEIMIAVQGKAKVHLHGENQCETVELASPDISLLVPPGTWHIVDLEDQSILLVYSSVTIEEDKHTSTDRSCACSR